MRVHLVVTVNGIIDHKEGFTSAIAAATFGISDTFRARWREYRNVKAFLVLMPEQSDPDLPRWDLWQSDTFDPTAYIARQNGVRDALDARKKERES